MISILFYFIGLLAELHDSARFLISTVNIVSKFTLFVPFFLFFYNGAARCPVCYFLPIMVAISGVVASLHPFSVPIDNFGKVIEPGFGLGLFGKLLVHIHM